MSASRNSLSHRGRPPIRSRRGGFRGTARATGHRTLPNLRSPDQLWRRLFVWGGDELEQLRGFRPGGYHPIHLQDELHDGRYRVIHKLGHGGFSTVWLCRDQHIDTPKYVAIKILKADQKEEDSPELRLAAKLQRECKEDTDFEQHLCLPTQQFRSQSPNGLHICLVYPVLGPQVKDARELFYGEDDVAKTLQSVSRRTVEVLASLHKRGICHGDFTPANVLLELKSLDGLEETALLTILGQPETLNIAIRKDPLPTPEIPYAPKYLVYPVDFEAVASPIISPRTQAVDFGQSFDFQGPHSTAPCGIPANYAAPEVAIDKCGSIAMDTWSLGCTLFEIRHGHQLFSVFQFTGTVAKGEYMAEISSLLGEPPEIWAQYYNEPDSEPETGEITPDEDEGIPIEPHIRRARSIHERLVNCHDCVGTGCTHPRFELISDYEATILADLLERLLRYQPEDRLSAEDALKHAWFSMQF